MLLCDYDTGRFAVQPPLLAYNAGMDLRTPCLFQRWLAALLLAVLAGCSALPPADFDPPQVRLLGLRPLSVDAMEARFSVELRVLNPNAIALDVEGLYFEVFVHDSQVLSGASARAANIPAYGEGTVTLETTLGVLRAVTLMRELAEKPRGALPYTLKTKISLAQLPYPLRLEDSGVIGQE